MRIRAKELRRSKKKKEESYKEKMKAEQSQGIQKKK